MTRGHASSGPSPPRPRSSRLGRMKGGSDREEVTAYKGRVYHRTVRIGGCEVTLAEAPRVGSTGSEVWRVAEHLVSFLENELEPAVLKGKRVVELGCGCGLLGLAVAILSKGQAEVIVTDYDPVALEMAQLNVELNKLSNCVMVRKFTWGGSVAALTEEAPFDFVLGSDIIYHPHCLQQLQKSLQDLTSPHTTTLIAYEHRQPALEQRFFSEAAQKHSLACNRIKRRYLDKREDASLLSIYHVKKQGPSVSGYRPESGTTIIQRSNNYSSSNYRRPFSAAATRDRPALTCQTTANEVRQVNYRSLNKARIQSARGRSSEGPSPVQSAQQEPQQVAFTTSATTRDRPATVQPTRPRPATASRVRSLYR